MVEGEEVGQVTIAEEIGLLGSSSDTGPLGGILRWLSLGIVISHKGVEGTHLLPTETKLLICSTIESTNIRTNVTSI